MNTPSNERQSAGTAPSKGRDREVEERAEGAVAPSRLVRFWYSCVRTWYSVWHRRPLSGPKAIELMRDIYESLEILGAPSDLLATVGSFRETMSDVATFTDVKRWNQINRSRNSHPSQCLVFLVVCSIVDEGDNIEAVFLNLEKAKAHRDRLITANRSDFRRFRVEEWSDGEMKGRAV